MNVDFVGAGWAFPLRTDATGGIALVRGEREIEESHPADPRHRAGRAADAPSSAARSTTTSSRPADAATAGQIAYEVRDALERWEPRIDLDDVGVRFDRGRRRARSTSTSRYAVRGTNDPRNLVFPFYVIPRTRTARRR